MVESKKNTADNMKKSEIISNFLEEEEEPNNDLEEEVATCNNVICANNASSANLSRNKSNSQNARKTFFIALKTLFISLDSTTTKCVFYSNWQKAVTLRRRKAGMKVRGSIVGRRWTIACNSISWINDYAIQRDHMSSGQWKANLRIPFKLFAKILIDLSPRLRTKNKNMRKATPCDVKLAAFLMWVGGRFYSAVASQLGIGTSSVGFLVRDVANALCEAYPNVIRLPRSNTNVVKTMNGFEDMSGLPYCVGAIDGCHIPWVSCPSSQFYDYRCYKGFPSLVLFAVCDANRHFLYCDSGYPGIIGDSTLYEISELKKQIMNGEWLGTKIPSLIIFGAEIRPYLIGDCAFRLSRNMMKSKSKKEQKLDQDLVLWEKYASRGRKPIECAFWMLKRRFPAYQKGITLYHEDEASNVIRACTILHNLCIDIGFDEKNEDFESTGSEDEIALCEEGTKAKIARKTLLKYVLTE